MGRTQHSKIKSEGEWQAYQMLITGSISKIFNQMEAMKIRCKTTEKQGVMAKIDPRSVQNEMRAKRNKI